MYTQGLPINGTVIRYRYLWSYEYDAGLLEGRKDRPAALVVSKNAEQGYCVVVPITHTEPVGDAIGIEIPPEIPPEIRASLGLDNERQWIVLTDLNNFRWPGPDLREVPGRDPETCIYGTLPREFFQDVLTRLQTLVKAKRVATTGR